MDNRKNYFVMADPDKCLGCRNCETACVLAHVRTDLHWAVSQKPPLLPRIAVKGINGRPVPTVCRQCEEAPCVQACPTGALDQEDGFVGIAEEKCIGCRLCVKSCPFGSIRMQAALQVQSGGTGRGKAVKCDLCSSRRGDERGFKCACVAACPTKALVLTNAEESRRKYPGARPGKPA